MNAAAIESLQLRLVGVKAKINTAQLARTGHLLRAESYRAQAAEQEAFSNQQAYYRVVVAESAHAERLLREITDLMGERDELEHQLQLATDLPIPLPVLSREALDGTDDMAGIVEVVAA